MSKHQNQINPLTEKPAEPAQQPDTEKSADPAPQPVAEKPADPAPQTVAEKPADPNHNPSLKNCRSSTTNRR